MTAPSSRAREVAERTQVDDLRCPFCGEQGFDAFGLKAHLLGVLGLYRGCKAFEQTTDPARSLKTPEVDDE